MSSAWFAESEESIVLRERAVDPLILTVRAQSSSDTVDLDDPERDAAKRLGGVAVVIALEPDEECFVQER